MVLLLLTFLVAAITYFSCSFPVSGVPDPALVFWRSHEPDRGRVSVGDGMAWRKDQQSD